MINKEEFIFLKKNKYLKTPRMIQIEITNKCTLNCPQCYKGLDKEKNMDMSVFMKLIDEAYDMGVKHVMLNGGEPLLHPMFTEMVAYLTQCGMCATCYTSGLSLTRSLIPKIKNLNIEMIFSLNGSCKEIHEISRDGFDITFHAIQLFRQAHMDFYINWVARHDNVKDLPNLIRFAKKNGASGIIIVGNKLQRNGEIDSPLTKSDYDFLKYVFSLNDNEKYLCIQNCYNILAQYIYNMPISKTYGCSAGITACFITKDGKFAPCSHLNYIEEYNGLRDYWENSIYLKQLRDMEVYKLPHCDTCTYSMKCRFCRAYSKICYEDFSKGYDSCPIYSGKEKNYGL